MAKQPIVITGLNDVTRLLNEGNRKVEKAARLAVTEVTTEVAAKADDLVPFDTGTLSGSQVVKLPLAGRIEGEITYGGPAAPYAAVQHENLELFHPSKKRGGTGPVTAGQGSGRGAKYLEFPTKMAFKDYDKKIVNYIKALIR
jgi:hypothetical protein